MPSLLQRQIFKEIANLFVLAVGVLLTLILISRAVQMRELFLGLDLGILDTVLLFGYMTPLFLMLVIPIACMLSVFLTFLRMSTDRELVALRAGGINIYQMLPAPLLFSVICMLLTLWVSLHWLAWGIELQKAVVMDERAEAGLSQDNAAVITGEYSVVDDEQQSLTVVSDSDREEAREYVSAILNSLDSSAADAKAMFKRAEDEINAMAEKLGEEYHQGFMTTLNDMRPEFE